MRGIKQVERAMRRGKVPGHVEVLADELERGLVTFNEFALALRIVAGTAIPAQVAAANLRDNLRRMARWPAIDYRGHPLVACGISSYPGRRGRSPRGDRHRGSDP